MATEKKIILILSLFIITMTYIIYPFAIESTKDNKLTNNDIIRFHVIANSDSPEDQNLKLKIRDRVLDEMGNVFAQSNSIEESYELIEANMGNIKRLAEDETAKGGKDYGVDVILGKDLFPTKMYGDMTFPAGEYEALKLVIGEGKGKNWWCVMFPPLCFVDITHCRTTSNANSNDKEVKEMVLKSKVVEIFEKTKVKFAKIHK